MGDEDRTFLEEEMDEEDKLIAEEKAKAEREKKLAEGVLDYPKSEELKKQS